MKRDSRGRRRTGITYNGLLKALERQQGTSLPIMKKELRDQVRRRLARIDPASPWLLLAVDGSKEDLPRTRDHERVFGIADNGVFPQAFLTAVVESHTGLLWDWRIGEGRASEKKHLMEMIDDLPHDALLLADGAFIGLPIWEKLCTQGKSFLIRVGGNVHLLTDLWPEARTHRRKDIVYVWPKKSRKTKAPIRLRLIKVGSASKTVHLLTNVLDTKRLSRKMAGTIYRRRWGVEIFYRTLKRTWGCAKLRSKAARRAWIELEWTLVALTIATLLGVDATVKRRRDPRRLSPAQLIRTLRESLRRNDTPHTRTQPGKALGYCLKDSYQRKGVKHSRHRIITRDTPKTRLQPPIVQKATHQERLKAIKHRQKIAA
jgi:hypothetical protein